jgi:cysteine-rich repeat protein
MSLRLSLPSVIIPLSLLSLAACPTAGGDRNPFVTGGGETTGDGDESTGDGDSGDGDGEPSTCGDMVVDLDEQCDFGPANAEDGQCTPECMIAACGDGFLYTDFEDCDDGNRSNSDECLDNCKVATCGDGFVHEGYEASDDGNDN